MEFEVFENLSSGSLNKIRTEKPKGKIFIYKSNCFGKYDIISFKNLELDKNYLKTELLTTLAEEFRKIDLNRSGFEINPLVNDSDYGFNFVMSLKILDTGRLTKDEYKLFNNAINLKSDKFEIKDLTNSVAR